jgi:ASC-1-like (ASCH) protein
MSTIYIKQHSTFKQIVEEIKTIELRKKSKFISQLSQNQTIKFVHNTESVECYVQFILCGTFDEIIKKVNIHNLNKNIKSEKDAIKLYSLYYGEFNTKTDFIAIFFYKKP